MTNEILILLLAFQAKHLIADYYLQFRYMYENKGKKKGWILPLILHSGIHAYFTMLIVGIHGSIYKTDATLYFALTTLIGTMLFDFTTHFIIDRWKATRKSTIDTNQFWYNLGLDQTIHHIVGILIIWSIV